MSLCVEMFVLITHKTNGSKKMESIFQVQITAGLNWMKWACVCVLCCAVLILRFVRLSISLAWMSFASQKAPSPLMLTYSPYCMAYKISHRIDRSSFHSSFNVLNLAFAERSSHRYELLIANTDHDELTSSHIDVNWWLFSLCFLFLFSFASSWSLKMKVNKVSFLLAVRTAQTDQQ